MTRLTRTLAMAAASIVAGAGVVVATAAPASAAVFTNPPGTGFTQGGIKINSGTDNTTFSIILQGSQPNGNICADGSLAFTADMFDINDQYMGAFPAYPGSTEPENGMVPRVTTGAWNIALLKTVLAGSFQVSGTYTVRFDCYGGDGNVSDSYKVPFYYDAATSTFTYTDPEVPAVATTTTLAAGATTVEVGTAVALTATVAPVVTAGSVEFFTGATSLGVDSTPADGFTLSTTALPVGTASLTAVYSGATGFTGSTSAPVAVTVNSVAPRATTTTVDSVSPLSADPFTSTTITCSVAAGTGSALGTLQFRVDGAVLGTVPVTGNGAYTFTTGSIGAGDGQLVDCVFVGSAPYTGSTAAAVSIDRAGTIEYDEQTVIVDIPVGTLTITTPYTETSPLNLGTAVLDPTASTYSAQAAFDRVSITDVRAGQLGFTASLVAGTFANGTSTFGGQYAGFENVTAVQVAGNALQAADVDTFSTVANAPGLATPTVFASYPAGLSLGTVEVTALFTVDGIPTSVQPGVYTSTVTFTAI